jgi:hypothetical protein
MASLPPTEETDFRPPTIVTTPEANPVYEVSITEHAKERVRNADPNKDHICLVTNSELAMTFAHCVERCCMRDVESVCVYPLVFILGFMFIYDHSSIALSGIGI